MGGCNWQNKSFSVAVCDKQPGLVCIDCGIETEGQYKHNGDVFCKECFGKKSKIASFSLGFNTHKDLMYNFTTEMFNGKPVAINSKRQFKGLLKQHNLADASIKEAKQEALFRKRLNAEDDVVSRRKTAENIMLRNRDRLKFRRG